MVRKVLSVAVIVLMVVAVGIFCFHSKTEESDKKNIADVPYIGYTHLIPKVNVSSVPVIIVPRFKESALALQYGVIGYIDIISPEDSSIRKTGKVGVKRGGEVNVTLLLKFIPHTPDLKEVGVILDTMGKEDKDYIEQYYTTTDEKGNIKRGSILIDDLITYTPKYIVLKPNKITPVIMTIRIPQGFPISSLSFAPPGIRSELPKVIVFYDQESNLFMEVNISD